MAARVLKFRLFLGSYSLLFALFAIRFTDDRLVTACAAIAIGGFLDNWRITRLVREKEADTYEVNALRDKGGEVAGYLATYLLPFVTVSTPTARDMLAYLIFLAVTCIVYVRSEMVQINPVLYLLNRRVFAIKTTGDVWVHLIAKTPPEVGASVDAVPLRGNYVLVEVGTSGKVGHSEVDI